MKKPSVESTLTKTPSRAHKKMFTTDAAVKKPMNKVESAKTSL